MKRAALLLAIVRSGSCDDKPTSPSTPTMSFFVTSATSVTGNLGGLQGADATCLRLAQSVGQGSRTWRAYLSAEKDSDEQQSARLCARSHWRRSLVQREPRAGGKQRGRAARGHG